MRKTKEQNLNNKILKTNKGITLTSFVITIIALLLIVGLVFTYNYVYQSKQEEIKPEEKPIEQSKYYEPTQEELARAKQLEEILRNNLPKMDGSTSTIPLEGGIRAALFDVSQEVAEAAVVHSTTYGSFDNLINDKCEVIFSTPLSKEQYDAAKGKNIELELTPVVYEGFVFVVNASNPVESLTQQQIKDIYSGKITNWKQVGGNDAEIVAYQRNSTSGSQNYMTTFMGDTKLMEPITEFVPASMSGLMDAVAYYDNAENAIGYSVYAYAADMYGNGNEIKFIKVDGVEPTKQTMASGEYPLLNYNYAIYDKNQDENSTVEELVEWILTYNGQKAMINAGYVPVKNLEVKEATIKTYNQKGTGKVKTKDYESYYYEVYQDEDLVSGLKNKELKDKINNFIEDSKKKLKEKQSEYEKYIQLLNGDKEWGEYSKDGIVVETKCINGYLSVQVLLKYQYAVQTGTPYVYDGYSKVYDLYTGKELNFSDLYYKDVDFITYLNENSQGQMGISQEMGRKEKEIKRNFSGIPDGISIFGLNTISYTKYNPYFTQGEIFEFEPYFENISIIYEARDMKDIWKENIEINKNIYEFYDTGEIVRKETEDIIFNIFYVDTNQPNKDKVVNEYIDKSIEKIDEKTIKQGIEKAKQEYGFEFYDYQLVDGKYEIDVNTQVLGKKYVKVTCYLGMDIEVLSTIIIDLETGNVLEMSDEEVYNTLK